MTEHRLPPLPAQPQQRVTVARRVPARSGFERAPVGQAAPPSGALWLGHGIGPLLLAAGLCVLLLAIVMAITFMAGRAARLPIEDRIVAIFCGSKKTLASGVPMARLMFGADPGLSLILLPLMIYHPLQLVVCGWFASRWARREPDVQPSEPTQRVRPPRDSSNRAAY